MHVVMFGDQHVESLGGAQVSMRLQRRFLERAGHTVTIVAPRMHGPRAAAAEAAYIDTPSIPITPDREYALSWPGRRTDRFVDAALASRPPVDVVHVQGDFWGAFIGHRFAARHGLAVVHTMHNRVDVGIEATAPFPRLVLRVLNAWQRRALRDVPGPADAGRDGWAYLRRFAARSDAVTAPSVHFARRLQEHGAVSAAGESVIDVWNGIDDDVLDAALRHPSSLPAPPAEGSPLAGSSAEGSPPAGSSAEGSPPAGPSAESSGSAGSPAESPVAGATRRTPASADGVSASRTGLSTGGEGRARFVWLGRMSPEKRLLPFLEAVAESGIDADVEIIGAGGQQKAARRLVKRLAPTASVVFAGRQPYVETLRRIAAADAVVQTSIGFETQGMTVFEAASLGTPAIVSDPDIADELGSGLWAVADGSVAALAETLRAAAADIAAGTAPVPDASIAERFRQSSRTAAMVEVYERARVRGR